MHANPANAFSGRCFTDFGTRVETENARGKQKTEKSYKLSR